MNCHSCVDGHHFKDDSELFDGSYHRKMKLQCAHAIVLYPVLILCAFAGNVNKYLYLYLLV